MKRTPLKRTPLKKRNPKRAKQRFENAFGEKSEWVRTLPCVVEVYFCVRPEAIDSLRDALECGGKIEAMHTTSRGAGGITDSIIPCCQKHHREFHDKGHITTAKKYGLSLTMAADVYEFMWQTRRAA